MRRSPGIRNRLRNRPRGNGHAVEHLPEVSHLGPRGLQELEPGGRGEEEVFQLDHRATRKRRGAHRLNPATRDRDHGGLFALSAAGDSQTAHSAERGQSLAAKAEGADIEKVGAVDLGGRVARQSKRQVVRRHAAAIVCDPDQRLAAIGDHYLDPCRARVERVFDKLFGRRGGPLHDLARRDPVNGGIVQLPDDRARAHLEVGLGHTTTSSMAPADSARD